VRLAAQRHQPRQPARPTPTTPGTIDHEKSWVRGWIDETYLWYGEVPTTLKAADYATPVAFFSVLKTPATTASGRAKDRFHFTYDTEEYRQLSQGGVSPGYGIEFAFVRSSPPREHPRRLHRARLAGQQAQMHRSAATKMLEVDGVDVVNGTSKADGHHQPRPLAAGHRRIAHLQAFGADGATRPSR
jgi:carboxyl-terminal processing protease